jgi:predicted metalloprotease with PDZ domain
MRLLAGLAALAAPLSVAAAPGAPPPIAYRLTPVMHGGGLTALEVQIDLQGDADGETRIDLPRKWAGTDELWKQVSGFTAEGASVSDDGPAVRVLRHAPRAAVRLRYRVRAAADGDPGANASKANPIVRPGWFYAMGEGLFAEPEGREHDPITFAWGPLPAGWKVASDLEHSGGRGALEDIVESTTIGGPGLRVTTRQAPGATIRVAVLGDWPARDEAVADLAARIVGASNGFWGDRVRPYLLTVGPLAGGEGGRISTNGTGRGDAFAVLSTTNVDLTGEAFFLSHEYQHTWIGRQIGGTPDQDEALDYWLTEGFTDHYASRNLLRAGVWSLADVLARDNEILVRYAASPARTMTAAEILPRFWSDQAAQQSPYDRGRLLALILDADLRRASKGRLGLDQVMLAQRREAAANARAGRKVSAATLFPQVYRRIGGLDAAPLIERHVGKGAPIQLPADVYGPCVTVDRLEIAAYDRGFDAAASAESGVITGVDKDGPAYAAGLRDGMKRLAREGGKEGDSRVELGYRVADAAGERWIRYRPEGRAKIALQQLALKPGLDANAQAACVRDILRR